MNQSIRLAWDRTERLERIFQELTECIDDLALSVQYLLFDLEATKRENQELREMLAQQR